jgi:hypothetical protein
MRFIGASRTVHRGELIDLVLWLLEQSEPDSAESLLVLGKSAKQLLADMAADWIGGRKLQRTQHVRQIGQRTEVLSASASCDLSNRPIAAGGGARDVDRKLRT